MASSHKHNSSVIANSSSRRVYLLRRTAFTLLVLGILLFFVETSLSFYYNIGFIVAAIVLWLLSAKMEKSKRSKVNCDENGNALKRKL